MARRLLIAGSAVVLVLAAPYGSARVPLSTGAVRTGSLPDAPAHAVRGPHPVGTRHLTRDDDAPLDIVMWYPAAAVVNPDPRITYPYEIGMPAPIGRVNLATYEGRATRDAPHAVATVPYPLVIPSPGLSIAPSAYAWLAEHLASYGLVVVTPDHQERLDGALDALWQPPITRPGDILAVLDYVEEQVGRGGALDGLVDADAVAVIGHSYGGYTSLAVAGARLAMGSFAAQCAAAGADQPSLWLCDEILPHVADMAALAGLDPVPEGLWLSWSDPRVDAVVSMAGDAFFFGKAGLAEITVPVMVIGGTADDESPYMWETHPTYEHVSSATKVKIALEDAEHRIFTNPCEAIPLLLRLISSEFCSDRVWDRHDAHDLTKHFATGFLLAQLKQDTDAAASLVPGSVAFPGVTYEAQGYDSRSKELDHMTCDTHSMMDSLRCTLRACPVRRRHRSLADIARAVVLTVRSTLVSS